MGISATQERYVNFNTDSAFNKKELHDYRESQKDFWDLNSVIETAERKGFTNLTSPLPISSTLLYKSS